MKILVWFAAAMDSLPLGAALGAQIGEQLVDLLGVEAEDELLVGLHHRRLIAGGEALNLAEREHAVVGGLAELAAEATLEVLEDLGRAEQHAADVRADLEVMLPLGLE